jgi:hypothetical protein
LIVCLLVCFFVFICFVYFVSWIGIGAEDGKLFCWGLKRHGVVPKQVLPECFVKDVAIGPNHTLVCTGDWSFF